MLGADVQVPVTTLVLFPFYFLLGFLLYSASFAAVGAAVNSEQEAQQFNFVVMSPIIISMMVMMYIIRQPSAPWSVALSLFPFTAPICMFLRISVLQPPMWQIAASIVLMAVAVFVMMWLCARIYRIGILMYGKRPTLPEILKWMRYA
jgi:ABC-type Na+ efflux pump, permease component